MTKYSKREFATLCGIQSKHLSMHVARKKVIVKRNKIDDTDEINQAFLQRMVSKQGGTIDGAPAKKKGKPEASPEEIANKATLTEILKQRGNLDLDERKNKIELQKIELQKKRGELVPTSAIRLLIVQHSENIKTSYNEAADKMLVIISQKHQLSAVDVADIRKQQTKFINKAIDDSITSTKKQLQTVIQEFSVKRGVGQHD